MFDINRSRRGIAAALLLVAVATGARAQPQLSGAAPTSPPAAPGTAPFVMPLVYTADFRSKINQADYRLTIVLPPGYDGKQAERYPVLYVMDGNRWAVFLGSIVPEMSSRGVLPNIIIVGVDYPGKSERWQDYGLVTQRYFPVDPKRGAATYLRVMQEEVIPFVDSRYRTNPADRAIAGHSMGGLFSAYALLHASDTFQRFWLSSPSLFWDDEILFKDFDRLPKALPRALHVFTDVGEDELPSLKGTLERFNAKLTEGDRANKVIFASTVVPGATHATAMQGSFVPALEHLYTYRKPMAAAASDLLRYAGQYKLADGTVISLVSDGRNLLYTDSTVDFHMGARMQMRATGPNSFYMRSPMMEIQFPEGSGKPQSLRISDAFGATKVAVRLPDAAGRLQTTWRKLACTCRYISGSDKAHAGRRLIERRGTATLLCRKACSASHRSGSS